MLEKPLTTFVHIYQNAILFLFNMSRSNFEKIGPPPEAENYHGSKEYPETPAWDSEAGQRQENARLREVIDHQSRQIAEQRAEIAQLKAQIAQLQQPQVPVESSRDTVSGKVHGILAEGTTDKTA